MTLPSESCPTAARGCRVARSIGSKFSPVVKSGFPPLTSCGPPPTAETTELHASGRINRTATCVSNGASAWSFAASAPVATMTAPSEGIATWPVPTADTVAFRSVPIAASGNGSRTMCAAFDRFGVEEPHAGVKRIVWLPRGCWLTPSTGRRWPVPFQVPLKEMRPTCIDPFASNPIDTRAGVGTRTSAPFAITIPDGYERPPLCEKKSPLTPATVTTADTLRSSCVSVSARAGDGSRPPSTGPIAVTPVGAGAVITE